MAQQKNKQMEKLVSLCKRRGIIFPSSEIYGGIGSCWDYGPFGVELKRNVKDAWWRAMTLHRDDVEGIDAAILMHPRVWEASGHVAGFSDPLLDCRTCKKRFREDEVRQKEGKPPQCPYCGSSELGDVRQFNLMFKTFMGPVEDSAAVVFLRPETAQGIYVNFHNVRETARRKIPFGIAQIGKAFRNEITPGNFIFRTREFEQMEMQYFIHPSEDDKWMEYWRHQRMNWYLELGVNKEKLRFHQHRDDELAHYAKVAYDIEYEFPFGWQEIEGIHNRTDYDLKRHQEYSTKDLTYFDDARKEKYLPYIIETSAGVDRAGVLAILADAYAEEEDRTVLRLHPRLAPVKAGVFPLVKKDGMPEMAKKIAADLRRRFKVFYDESGAVGRRYYRQDELGTPFCVTVDSDSLSNQDVTVRERDSKEQVRVGVDALGSWLAERLEGDAGQ